MQPQASGGLAPHQAPNWVFLSDSEEDHASGPAASGGDGYDTEPVYLDASDEAEEQKKPARGRKRGREEDDEDEVVCLGERAGAGAVPHASGAAATFRLRTLGSVAAELQGPGKPRPPASPATSSSATVGWSDGGVHDASASATSAGRRREAEPAQEPPAKRARVAPAAVAASPHAAAGAPRAGAGASGSRCGGGAGGGSRSSTSSSGRGGPSAALPRSSPPPPPRVAPPSPPAPPQQPNSPRAKAILRLRFQDSAISEAALRADPGLAVALQAPGAVSSHLERLGLSAKLLLEAASSVAGSGGGSLASPAGRAAAARLIRLRYHLLARLLHPDRGLVIPGYSAGVVEEAFKSVAAAYTAEVRKWSGEDGRGR